MTEKQEETCENCGHEKKKHVWVNWECIENIHPNSNGYAPCTCKKFVAKNHKITERTYPRALMKPKNHSPQKTRRSAQDGCSNSLSVLDKEDTPSETAYEQAKAEGTFNLSEEIDLVEIFDDECEVIKIRYVKEAVKRLKETRCSKGCNTCKIWLKEIDKIFGEELI